MVVHDIEGHICDPKPLLSSKHQKQSIKALSVFKEEHSRGGGVILKALLAAKLLLLLVFFLVLTLYLDLTYFLKQCKSTDFLF